MKKNNLFKAVGIVILIYILMSWIVPIIYGIGNFKGEVSHQIGFVSIMSVILETFSGFGSVVLYVLLIGAFYGVLKITGAYDKIIECVATKVKGKEKGTLIGIIIAMALISSISGLDLGLLVVFPILIALLVKMGYDKIVALGATLGATIIGMYGATFAGTLYGINNTILGLKTYSQFLPKVILLVVGVVVLILFVLAYCKEKNFKFDDKKVAVKSTAKKEAVKSSAKKSTKVKKAASEKTKEKGKTKKERGVLPALIIVGVVMLILFIGTTSWEGIFGSNWFSTAHTSWTGVKIGGFEILNKLFGGIDAFGLWNTPTRFQIYSMILILAMVALAICYRTKPSECFDGFVDGIKSFVVPAILTILASSLFVFIYYNPVITPVMSAFLGLAKEFNIAISGIYTIINSVFYVDYYYLAYSVLYSLTSVYDDANVLSILSVMFTNLYSLVMLVAPTSVLLLISLSISDVKYTEWLKFIWKIALVLLVVSFITFMVMMLV